MCQQFGWQLQPAGKSINWANYDLGSCEKFAHAANCCELLTVNPLVPSINRKFYTTLCLCLSLSLSLTFVPFPWGKLENFALSVRFLSLCFCLLFSIYFFRACANIFAGKPFVLDEAFVAAASIVDLYLLWAIKKQQAGSQFWKRKVERMKAKKESSTECKNCIHLFEVSVESTLCVSPSTFTACLFFSHFPCKIRNFTLETPRRACVTLFTTLPHLYK